MIKFLVAVFCIPAVLLPPQAGASAKGPKTPEEAFRTLSRNVTGQPPPSSIRYVPGKKPFVIVTFAQYTMGHLIKARTPYGMVYARRYDLHLMGPEGGAAVMGRWGIVVNAPKQLRVVLHAPFTPTDLTINGKLAYDAAMRPTVRAGYINYNAGPQVILAQYGTIILPGGRTVMEYVVA